MDKDEVFSLMMECLQNYHERFNAVMDIFEVFVIALRRDKEFGKDEKYQLNTTFSFIDEMSDELKNTEILFEDFVRKIELLED